ncbi:MAG: hypothetical protein VYB57_04620, partial [Cyanobacteriota bacterium]|nr:hypothetical protein [Cyanobacteriota bacterium]
MGPVKLITITVERPTAAEHTKQPASIKENSLLSLADCIKFNAQATKVITTATSDKPIKPGNSSKPL